MSRLRSITFLAVTAALVLAVGAHAEDPVALIVEGLTPAGVPADHIVDSIAGPAVNHSGGWAFNFNSTDGTETLGRIWGNAIGGPGDLIRTEGLFPPYQQNSYESFWGFGGGGAVCYSAISDNIDNGSTSLDGVWLDDTPVAVEEEVFPHIAGYWWSFGSRPGVTEDGVPYFVGGLTEVQGGSTDLRGLFYGPDAAPVALGGDVLPGLPFPLDATSSISFDYRFSAMGAHWIAEGDMDTGSSSDDGVMILDGEGLVIDGTLVREGNPVPATAGGLPGENWDNFDKAGVTETGSYMFTGDTDGDTATDEIVVIDGMIVHREGDMIGDLTLAGSIENAFMNEDGDYAITWDVDLPTGENVEVLIFNGEVVLMEGDIIDVDGDGIPEPDAIVDGFTGTASLVVADRAPNGAVGVYFTADVTIPDAPAALGQPVDPAGDVAGMGPDDVVEERNRAVVEIGYGLTYGDVVPVLLSEFGCEPQADGVSIQWRVAGAIADAEFTLRGRNESRTWEVPFSREADGRFTALDRDATGAEVTYTLLIESSGRTRVLGEQGVRLDLPAQGVALQGAFPNPFNPATKVSFRVGTSQHVKLSVYDMSGRLVTVLADQVFAPGTHQVSWNGRDLAGASVPSGTYVARVSGGNSVQTAKLMLVK